MLSITLHHARRASGRLKKKPVPSEGIYYVIRTPACWELMPYLFGDGFGGQPESNHQEFWTTQVAPYLGYLWTRHLRPTARTQAAEMLAAKLVDHYYAFPRGRIDKGNGAKPYVRNGNNLTKIMPSKAQIERAFYIQGECEWDFDEHEQCMEEDTCVVREILVIKEKWPTIGLMD